jgi:hypothetical protein
MRPITSSLCWARAAVATTEPDSRVTGELEKVRAAFGGADIFGFAKMVRMEGFEPSSTGF